MNQIKKEIMLVTRKLAKGLSCLSLFAMLNLYITPAWAITAPTAPEAPTAPSVPSEPEAPTAPSSPDAPEAPQAPDAPTAPEAPESPVQNEEPADETNETPDAQTEESTDGQENATSSAPEASNAPELDNSSTQDESEAVAPTGEVVSGQSGDVEIDTGDATNTGSISNNLNNNLSTTITPQEQSSGITIANDSNGEDSTNKSSIVFEEARLTIQENIANVNNNLNLETNTGGNQAVNNPQSNVDIKTGDANTSGTIVNAVNTNVDGVAIAEFNIVEDHTGDIVLSFDNACTNGCGAPNANLSNSGNGENSTNTSTLDYSSQDINFQVNEANIDNNMVLASNSGDNVSKGNTGGETTINTGDANVSGNVINFANNNIEGGVVYSVVNVYGDLEGDIIFPEEAMESYALSNSGNGENSTNTTEANIMNSDATYQYNEANIDNNVNVAATTGGNTAADNTRGDNEIETGDTNVDVQVTNIANLNLIGDMWLVIVNEAGNWIGQIVGGAINAGTYAGSDGLEFIVDESGQVTVTNAGNGEGSTNTASLNSSNSTTTTQANSANITNNIDLAANTGGNSATHNSGGASIETGDANVILNLVNFVNNNISGTGRLYVNVVNVFGSWLGDFIAPGATQQANAQELVDDISQQVGDVVDQANSPAIGGVGFDQDQESANNQVSSEQAEPAYAPTVLAYAYTDSSTYVLPNVGQQEGQVAGATQTADDIVENVEAAVFNTATAQKPQKVNINLAWLILLAPPMVIGWMIRRRFA